MTRLASKPPVTQWCSHELRPQFLQSPLLNLHVSLWGRGWSQCCRWWPRSNSHTRITSAVGPLTQRCLRTHASCTTILLSFLPWGVVSPTKIYVHKGESNMTEHQTSEALDERAANYRWEAKSGLPPVFINKVLLEHGPAHSFIVSTVLSCHNGGIK